MNKAHCDSCDRIIEGAVLELVFRAGPGYAAYSTRMACSARCAHLLVDARPNPTGWDRDSMRWTGGDPEPWPSPSQPEPEWAAPSAPARSEIPLVQLTAVDDVDATLWTWVGGPGDTSIIPRRCLANLTAVHVQSWPR